MGNKIKVACIIDDDKIYVNLVKRIIKTKELCQNVLVFENGKEALDYFESSLDNLEEEKSIPEIIFLDLNMPIMDGWEFLENFITIRNKLRKLTTLYITSSSINPLDIKKANDTNGVKNYLSKPITIERLESIFSLTK